MQGVLQGRREVVSTISVEVGSAWFEEATFLR